MNNTIDAGDDGICMKGGAGKKVEGDGPCENILIQDNTVYHAHGGFVIGSEFSNGMKNIVVRHNTFSGTDTGLRFKSGIGRGGKCQNIYVSDIMMSDIKGEAIIFECTYADKKYSVSDDKDKTVVPQNAEYVPEWSDIHISNVVCRGAKTAVSFTDCPIRVSEKYHHRQLHVLLYQDGQGYRQRGWRDNQRMQVRHLLNDLQCKGRNLYDPPDNSQLLTSWLLFVYACIILSCDGQ